MKKDRKNAILDIVTNYEVDTQETLQALLLERGFNVTQATVSRDIKQLSLAKTMTEAGSYKYTLPARNEAKTLKKVFESLFADSAISMDRAMNTVVVKCHTGMANAVCSKLDNAGYANIVGTLAGDDTIFILMRTEADAEILLDSFKKITK